MAVTGSSESLYRAGRVYVWLRWLSLGAAVSIFALMVLGGIVRATGSGLGCPDWPLCHGRVLPPWQLEAVVEYTHRLVASAIVGPLVLGTCVVIWFAYRRELWLVVPATWGVALLLAQAMLGGAAVLNELSPAVVAAHLALGEALLGCMVLVLVVGYRGPLSVPSAGRVHGGDIGPFPFLMLASTVSVYVLLLSGTYVTATGAIAACMDWPLCQGSIIPHGKLALVHVAHRLAAAGVGILLMGTLHLGFRGRQRPPYIRHLSMAVASLFIFQVAVGAATIWLGFPDPLIALHVAIATAVWSLMVALLALSFARQSVLSGEASRA